MHCLSTRFPVLLAALCGLTLATGCPPGDDDDDGGSTSSSSSSSSSSGALTSSSAVVGSSSAAPSSSAALSSSSAGGTSSSGTTASSTTASSGTPDGGSCEQQCGEGCADPQNYGCGADGQHYCSACFAACAATYLVPCHVDGGQAPNPDAGSCGAPLVAPQADGGMHLAVLRGPGNPLAPQADALGGPVAAVSLKHAGLSTDSKHQALLFSTGTGLSLVELAAVDAAFGTLPVAFQGASYPFLATAGFMTSSTAIVPIVQETPVLGSAAGSLDALALTNGPEMSQPSLLYAVKLASGAGPTPLAPLLAHGTLGGYPTANVAFVGGSILYVRDDANQVVHALDLSTLPSGGPYPEVAARSFAAAGTSVANVVLNALTPSVNPVNGNLAVSYTDAMGTGNGGGLFAFDAQDGTAFAHARLPEPGTGLTVDLTVAAWNGTGDRLYVAWDAYDSSFVKVESRLLAFNVDPTAVTTFLDADPSTPAVLDPALTLELPAMHPTQVLSLGSSAGKEDLAVVTAPYMGMTRLDLYRVHGACGVEHQAQALLGNFGYSAPWAAPVTLGSRQLLAVGTANGVQVYEVSR